MIEAVIFDMDGVIVDSEPLHVKAEKKILFKYGVKIKSKELRKYTGTTAKYMFSELIKKNNLDVSYKKISKEKDELLYRLMNKKLIPSKGIIKLIYDLKEKKT
jgi:beta-phosphoglucomutase-like phosphatase (HAD superfamily)